MTARTSARKQAEAASDKPLAFEVKPRGKPIKHLPETTYALPNDNGRNLYERIAAKSRTDVNRLRITKGSDGSLIPNSRDNTIDGLALYEGSTLMVKDLGPQIAWRTVFIIEYFGPILLHPLVYYGRQILYKNPNSLAPFPPPTASMQLSFAMIVLHFLKREFETIFIHRFSAATMPAFNIFKNSAHYWLLSGLNIALFTYSPADFCPTSHDPPYPWWNWLSLALFVIGELGNLSTHITLMNLRAPGSTERKIPNSGMFKVVPVTCPNYFFETLAWLSIWMANRSLSTALFAVVACGQMAVWARKKEARYRKEFGSQYKKKMFSMIPGIV